MIRVISEGDQVPAFELPDADGNKVSSSDFEGKRYVVYFYPRDFTPGCTIEADEFTQEYPKFKKIGVQIVGISTDDVESHKKFVEKMKIPYVLLSDTDAKVCKRFGVWGKKQFMGKEYMGIQRSTFLVDKDGKVFKSYPAVKPKGHAEDVLNALSA